MLLAMARKLVVFGNVAVGPIAIGNVAVGYVAIGLSVAVGPIAIGINALGFVLALGVNAAGAIDLAFVNGIGAFTLTFVNAIGAFAWSFVNHGAHPAIGVAVALGEGIAAYALRPREDEKVTTIDPELEEQSVRLDCRDATDRGLVLRDGTIVRWSEDFDAGRRFELGSSLSGSAHVRARIRRVVSAAGDGYREGRIERTLEVVDARAEPLTRWWAPVFRNSLVLGGALAAAITIGAALLR